MMQVRLLCKSSSLAGREIVVSKEATIGKDVASNISFRDSRVSRNHARIFYDSAEQGYFIEDLKSRNGTWLDGERLRRKERLNKLHVITVGKRFDIFFQLLDAPKIKKPAAKASKTTKETASSQDTKPKQPKKEHSIAVAEDDTVQLPAAAIRAVGNHDGDKRTDTVDTNQQQLDDATVETVLLSNVPAETDSGVVLKFNDQLTYPLQPGSNSIGRAAENDVVIRNESTSRKHAVITLVDNTIRLEDLGSRNHTYADGHAVKGVKVLKPGMKVKFGGVPATIEQNQHKELDL